MLSKLSDELLLDSYLRALTLNLSQDFLLLLATEIERRNLIPFTSKNNQNNDEVNIPINHILI